MSYTLGAMCAAEMLRSQAYSPMMLVSRLPTSSVALNKQQSEEQPAGVGSHIYYTVEGVLIHRNQTYDLIIWDEPEAILDQLDAFKIVQAC